MCSLASRYQHLIKTFWPEWRDEQHPDGTVVWTSPTGQKYVARPGSRLLFPALCLPTDELPTAPMGYRSSGNRDLLMPKRRRTREQDRTPNAPPTPPTSPNATYPRRSIGPSTVYAEATVNRAIRRARP